ncbi:MAG TPA: hypothetical protein PLG90_05565 [Ignavibacteria bacterium]|nr:hypothetical protein [Ignavibacteria bacterium]
MRNVINPQDTFNNAENHEPEINKFKKKPVENIFTIPDIEKIVDENREEIKKQKNDEFPGKEKPEEFTHPDEQIKNPDKRFKQQ